MKASGAAFQSIFRNPLVSSGMLGVSNGTSFRTALAIAVLGKADEAALIAYGKDVKRKFL
ncbi:iron chelate uptake ABC transporter family permease subunit [Clostridium magnum]|uniref:iron chelate uptake ABC transporter family permease subunit n=1 Tax=Clostridium magnum TaxID=33954 RepID=UPI000B1C83AA|nr:iron chelate uptake ABC transporter family permease subunit [Clostridium magnum]